MKITTYLVVSVLILVPAIDAAYCPYGWISYSKHCYKIGYGRKMTFSRAVNYCKALGGYLVRLETTQENDFLRNYLKESRSGSAWMGLTDQEYEGIWRWYGTNICPTFSTWAGNNPNNDKNEDCGGFWERSSYYWNDFECSAKNIPVCERL